MTLPDASIDFETRGTVELKRSGVHKYAQHADTDVWCLAWAIGDAEPQLWTPGEPFPAELELHLLAGGLFRAWNAQFERTIWREVMVQRYGWPEVPLDQWVCTAAEAAAMSLPRSLDKAAEVLGVPHQKDGQGSRLMLQMARPRRFDKDTGEPVWWDDEVRKARLYEYCLQDVRTERDVARVIRRLSPSERETWLLDQTINDRGILLDRPLATAAKNLARAALSRYNSTLRNLTNGKVAAVTQVGEIKRVLAERGLAVESLDKAAVKRLLEEPALDRELREIIEIRAEAGKSSVAKIDAMLSAACDDDVLRGLLLYHGASTGRWAGKLVQPQNFPRPTIDDPEAFIDRVLAGELDLIDLEVAPLEVIASLLRSMLIARPGHRLIAGDYSAIECRIVNWLAGEQWVLDAFAAYDAGDKTQDPYILAAMQMFGLPYEEIKKFPHRQTGKFRELGCGFGMGAKKARSAARDTYGLVLSEAQAQEVVDSYRETHPRVTALWYDLNNAAIEAVARPGELIAAAGGKIKFTKRGGYLWMALPSKRLLCYPAPRIVDREVPWSTPEHPVTKPAVEVSGTDSYTKQWSRYALYGGLLTENAVQAIARDVMVEGMKRVEAAGYPVVLTVHDEVVAEPALEHGSVEEYARLLSIVPEWAAGCPISVPLSDAWEGHRYRK